MALFTLILSPNKFSFVFPQTLSLISGSNTYSNNPQTAQKASLVHPLFLPQTAPQFSLISNLKQIRQFISKICHICDFKSPTFDLSYMYVISNLHFYSLPLHVIAYFSL
jgi:hypothetical protein